jgi:iron complex outermembrane receptor protein
VHASRADTRHVSVFGNVAWALTDRFTLATGLRWQREDKKAVINNSVTRPGASLSSLVLTPATAPGGAPVNGSRSRDTDAVTWSITPQFRLNEALLAYLTAARGFKSGGFNTHFGNAPLSAREFGSASTSRSMPRFPWRT